MHEEMDTGLYEALKKLHDHIPRLADMLKLDLDQEIEIWQDIVDAKLLSRLSPDFPIVAAICGGGSSGKSTLFNSLVGAHTSPTGGRAGLNRRALFSVPSRLAEDTELLFDLARPFREVPEPLEHQEELTIPGKPLYVANQSTIENLVIVDTPDFDTGSRGAYTNREVTRMVLEASDIFIYIFTNSNYNNRDNTDFIAQMLTGIGKRKCFLIYRVYPSYTKEEVLDHAMTVARGIYGELADQNLLGVYRTDEDNQVAAGERFMKIRPIDANGPDFMHDLGIINATRIRLALISTILTDACQQAEYFYNVSQVALDKLRLYHVALQIAQSQAVREALRNFPINRIMRRFARVWAATDPAHVKIMRKTGNVIEFPFKMLLGAAVWAKDQLAPEKAVPSSQDGYAQKVDEDLVTAVTGLHSQAVSPQLAVSSPASDPHTRQMAGLVARIQTRKKSAAGKGFLAQPAGDGSALTFMVDAHPVVHPEQTLLQSRNFKSVLQSILAEKEQILGISQEMEADLKELADNFRAKMGLWHKINQTFWAFLNVLPATVAVTYVLSTGDPVGGAGIKIKLAGLFGATDLYALFAIPFTTGLKKAERLQIEEMLRVILQSWLKDKSKIVQHLFEKNITGGTIHSARRCIDDAEQLVENVNELLLICTVENETK